MYIESNHIVYFPSDLTLNMDSPFASWMEHSVLVSHERLSYSDEKDELMGVLQHKGEQHEKEILNTFLDRELSVVQITRDASSSIPYLMICKMHFLKPVVFR